MREGAAQSAAPPASGPAEWGLRRPPIPSHGEGRVACWACWGHDLLALDFGPTAHFDQRVGRPLCRPALNV
eukprot:15381972-Alexandrium_andersonii.AAC.1